MLTRFLLLLDLTLAVSTLCALLAAWYWHQRARRWQAVVRAYKARCLHWYLRAKARSQEPAPYRCDPWHFHDSPN